MVSSRNAVQSVQYKLSVQQVGQHPAKPSVGGMPTDNSELKIPVQIAVSFHQLKVGNLKWC